MKLKELINCEYDIEINDITINSKEVKEGSLFVCLDGHNTSGYEYIDEVIKNKASVIIANRQLDIDIPLLIVSEPLKVLEDMIQKFYPINKVKLIGITGTDGKTTSSLILKHLLGVKYNVGYIGTNGIMYNDLVIETKNTTPSNLDLHKIINKMENNYVDVVIIEVSSHAILQGRINNLNFNYAGFTNITHEHLDYHKTFDNYFNTKLQLFRNLASKSIAVINGKSEFSNEIVNNSKAIIEKYDIDIDTRNILINKKNTSFDLKINNKYSDVLLNLVGLYNVENALLAIKICLKENILIKDIIPLLNTIPKIDGRQNFVKNEHNINVIVDFAHTPNAILNVIKNTKEFTKGNTIIVMGSAGERDYLKRPKMGEIATEFADFVIFTDEDPKGENNKNILNDLQKNLISENHITIENRKDAINHAIIMAKSADSVLITGKGNEYYQEISSEFIVHNDIDEALKALKKK